MDITAVTLKAMENIPAEEFGNIALMQYKNFETHENISGEFSERAYCTMPDYGMSVYEAREEKEL